MKQATTKKRIPIIIGLVLILALLFANNRLTNSNQQTEGNTINPVTSPSPVVTPSSTAFTGWTIMPDFPTPDALTLTAMPTIPPTATSTLAPPACTFPLAGTTAEESTPEEYTFSEPQVVLTDTQPINIIQWLPDNRNLLLIREIRNNNDHLQSIELFNPQTSETLVYGLRHPTVYFANPAWVEGLGAVIYPATEILKFNESNGIRTPPYEIKRQLWISQGDSEHAQTIEDAQLTLDYLSVFSVSVNSDGDQIAYLNNIDKKIFRISVSAGSLEELSPLTFDPSQWDYRQGGSSFPVSFKATWQPSDSKIYLYSDGNNGNYSFLLDIDNGKICELNLFGPDNFDSWAMTAHWSSDGRYLAVVRTKGKLPISFSDLIILDAFTGELHEINAAKLDPTYKESENFVSDIAWSPDNHHLAVIGRFGRVSNLYLLDFLSEQIVQIPSSEGISRNIGESSLLWSDDGSQLLVKCPTDQEDRLCLFLQNIKP